MTETPQASEPILSRWFQRRRTNLALLRNDDYRRNLIALLVTNLRGLGKLPMVLGIVFIGIVGAWIINGGAERGAEAFEVLQILFGLAAAALGATLYSQDQQSGTFELLWLASGSEKSLLRMKLTTMLAALLLPMVPVALLASWYVGWELPIAGTLLHLMVNSLLILALLAWLGTWLPHSWAAGLLGAGILAVVYLSVEGSPSLFNPFRNPAVAGWKGHAFNRGLAVALSMILLSSAATRLRRTF